MSNPLPTDTPGKNHTCAALRPFGTSIFTEMSALANRHGAVNLSQGFPDFDGPLEIRQRASQVILEGPNQYVPSPGLLTLRTAIAEKMSRFYQVDIHPENEVTVTAGATEALAASLLGCLNPGDEVVLIDPAYDLYAPMVARAGGTVVRVPLSGDGAIDKDGLRAAFSPKTRAIVVNNPHNPCGKVYSFEELTFIGQLCATHDAIAIGDEVYEHLVYEGRTHHTLFNVPELRDRCIVVSSTAKTFSMTGWKVGYAIASPSLTQAIRMAHQFLSFCTPGALQEAMAWGIRLENAYYEAFNATYQQKRHFLCQGLADLGFDVRWPEGTYYVTVNIGKLGIGDDLAACQFLASQVGVAAIPMSFFYKDRQSGTDLIRLCFCKTQATLDEALTRLSRWQR